MEHLSAERLNQIINKSPKTLGDQCRMLVSREEILAMVAEIFELRLKVMPNIPKARLLELAKKYPPPQSWYEEDFSLL